MKNVHIIPTDKPSRLLLSKRNNLQFLKDNSSLNLNNHFKGVYQNISITSDEEIKEGDWFMDDNNSLKTSYKLSHVQFANPKKIILTTDQELIKDGVQAIDDEFLEWFVKNPSCEEVSIYKNGGHYDGAMEFYIDVFYGITIPKEEPKQETLEEPTIKEIKNHKEEPKQEYQSECICDIECRGFVNVKCKKPKKETLEEFIESQPYYGTCTYEYKEGIEVGAKWQQERSYSEEEVLDLLKALQIGYYIHNERVDIDKWFEQFKKK